MTKNFIVEEWEERVYRVAYKVVKDEEGNIVKKEKYCEELAEVVDSGEISEENIEEKLFDAIEEGHIGGVRYMLELGADLNTKDEFGRTPLEVSIEKNNQKIIKLISKKLDLSSEAIAV